MVGEDVGGVLSTLGLLLDDPEAGLDVDEGSAEKKKGERAVVNKRAFLTPRRAPPSQRKT